MKALGASPAIRRWWIFALVCWLIYAALVGSEGFTVAPWSRHDDDLFVRQAASIAAGQWLGAPFDPLTLAKAPLHSIGMAALMGTGLPVDLLLRLIYGSSAVVACWLAIPPSRLRWRYYALPLFLLDPWMLTLPASRFAREASFIPLSLLSLSLAVASLDRERHWPHGVRGLLPLATSLGLGLLLITRETRPVILLSQGLLLMLWLRSWTAGERLSAGRRLRTGAVAAGLALLLFAAPLLALQQVNGRIYGTHLGNDTEEGAFSGFYTDLTSMSLKGQSGKPYVPLRQSVIDAIVAEGGDLPLASVLRRLDPLWRTFGCRQRASTCGEIGGGWLIWALRDAIAASIPLADGAAFQRQLVDLRQNVGQLCRRSPQLFDCQRKTASYMPLAWTRGEPIRPLQTLQALIRKGAGLVLPPIVHWGPWPVEVLNPSHLPPQWRQLHLRPTSQASLRWKREKRQLLFQLGVIGRAVLAGAAVLSLGGWPKPSPAATLLLAYLLLQLGVLTLVEVTSFRADRYLVLLSPVLTMLLLELISNPTRHQRGTT